jgi:hypothetical protein
MLIFYICPDLAGENISHPNAFNVEEDEAGEVTLGAIKAAFPLKGEYHFTVQSAAENFADCHRPDMILPKFNSRIFLRVSETWPLEYGFQNGGFHGDANRNPQSVPNMRKDPIPNLKKDFQAATKDMGRGIKVCIL